MGNVSMAPMLKKEMAKIDWQEKTATEIKNLVRGLNPIMGTYTILQGKKLKIWRVEAIEMDRFVKIYPEFEKEKQRVEDLENGTIIYIESKEGVYVKAKNGIIKLLEVQAENSKKMRIQEYLNGNQIQIGQILE